MNQVSRNKILLTVIAILLLTNIAMVVLFLQVKKPEQRGSKRLGFTEKLKKDVGFSPQQMAIYEPKRDKFWATIRQQFDTIKSTKVDFYHFMYDPSIPDSTIQAKADEIGRQQTNLDLFVVRHFKDIRKLCTPQQLPKFDSLLPPLIERMTARPEKK